MSQLPQAPTPNLKISKKDAIEALWRKGVLSWKLDINQKEMYKFSRESGHKIVVIGSSRQIGKTYFLVTLGVEECIRRPYSIVKFVAPKVKDIRRIIAPLIREITSDAPHELRPTFKTHDNVFRFPNGSEIQLAGTDNGHVDSIRGNKAHLCIIDEAGFCDDLSYVVKSILIPTTTTTNGKIIMASTPPNSLDHDFVLFMRQAELEGRFIKKTIYDNPRLTQAQINDIIEASGGVDNVDFKREYLVEIRTSELDAVVPEFNADLKSRIVKEWKRPPFYDNYVAMDIGGRDLTAALFGYYDFLAGKIIIEDEAIFATKEMLSDNIAKVIKQKELALWSDSVTGEAKPVTLRVADNNNIILLNDLAHAGINFMPTLKDDADAALNNMRMLLRQEKIIINPKCKVLINHLESAIWNKPRTKYARSSDKGHFDAIDSLKYFCRNVNFSRNPFPPQYKMGMSDVMFIEDKNKAATPFEQKLSDQFKIRNPRKIRRY